MKFQRMMHGGGKGFTEWTNVKKAKPLFKGHKQPQEPLNDNYYNLLEKKTVEWQTNLMKKYKVDGLIYYHYYFKGKLLLEKPAENLLKWKEIDQPFFFCWANHTWYRSWEGSKELLMAMEYGTEQDWEKHFQYLLPFFKDPRYEKKDNMPLLMIFDSTFKEKKDYMTYLDKRCKESGFDGLYLIETCFSEKEYSALHNHMQYPCKRIFIREPSYSIYMYSKSLGYFPKRFLAKGLREFDAVFKTNLQKARVFDGNKVYQTMIDFKGDSKCIRGGFFAWDNTPRHGNRGYIITSPKYEMFKKFYQSISDQDYLFINAWNEWCEGMMLEPTKNEKYKYLEWIRDVKEQ